MLKLVIFDFDGVIVDSERAHYDSFRQALLPEGIDLSWELYCQKYLCYSDLECIPAALADFGYPYEPELINRIFEEKKDVYERFITTTDITYPGVEALLKDLRANRIQIAIYSGSLTDEIKMILQINGLTEYFPVIVGAEEVKQGKPHPEGYLLALARVNEQSGSQDPVKPNECVVIEDSIGGVQAAQGAGMKCLAVTNSYPAEQLSMADAVTNGLTEVTAQSLQNVVD